MTNEIKSHILYNPVRTWKEGDTWLIRTWLRRVAPPGRAPKGPEWGCPHEAVCVVERSNDFLHVKIAFQEFTAGSNDYFVISFWTQSFTMAVFHWCLVPTKSNFPANAPAIIAWDDRKKVPFDFPLLESWATNYTFQVEGKEVHQRIDFDETGDGFTTTLTTQKEGIANKDERKVIQRWEPGLPWWKWAKEYINGELKRHGELVLDENGNPKKPFLNPSPE